MKNVAKLFVEYARLDRDRIKRGLTAPETERWAELKQELDATFDGKGKGAQPEKRASIRVPMRLECKFETLGTFEKALITNLSRGGVFMPSDAPLPIGSKLRLHLTIDETLADLEVDGEVVSHHVGPGYDTEMPGMGIRFNRVSLELAEQLDEICRRQLERSGEGEG